MSAQEPLTAEQLAEYQALDLGDTDGRVSASCSDGEHPTWLRKPNDTRGCPWCEVNRLTVELARWREPSAAEIELCDRWMAKYGDDPARWPHTVHQAYQNTLAEVLSGGQS